MLRKDLCLQCRKRSPSPFMSEFDISRLHLRKQIWSGFPKLPIFRLNIMLRKWSCASTLKLVFHIRSTFMKHCLSKKENQYSYFSWFLEYSMWQRWDERVRKVGNRDSASSTAVMILISCASCSCICGVFTLKIMRVVLGKKITSSSKEKESFEMCDMGLSTYWKASSNKYLSSLYIRSF